MKRVETQKYFNIKYEKQVKDNRKDIKRTTKLFGDLVIGERNHETVAVEP